MALGEILLKLSEEDKKVGYLYLPNHTGKISSGIVKKTISMNDLKANYKGIPLYFDFDENDELIGIEIVG